MAEIDVIRHVIRRHTPAPGEDYDPASDRLVIVHRNPEDPDDPTEFGHTIPLQGIAYRKEMWGLDDYASTIDMELKDLERYYLRDFDDESYGVHPLATITDHYFEGPRVRMRSFAPDYVMDRVVSQATAVPLTTDGVVRMCLDTVFSGIGDVKDSLACQQQLTYPCKGMTGLSTDSIGSRTKTMDRMAEQTQRLELVSSAPLDAVRQLLTDRGSELDTSRDTFVNHALLQGNVPEIMRGRVERAAIRRGILEEGVWT
jgi:hypothetical protein